MSNLITSGTATNILNVTRQELNTLVKFNVLKPERVNASKFLYNLNEVNNLLIVKKRVKGGLCTR